MNKTLTLEQRISIVRYRIENDENTLADISAVCFQSAPRATMTTSSIILLRRLMN